jgi:uncharacterized protein
MLIDRRAGPAALVLAALFAPVAAHAASFDCARAASAIEKRICADPQLSSDDERVAVEYRRALAAAPLPFAVRDDQRRWIADVRDKAVTNADLRAALVDRAARLNTQAAIDIAAALAVPLASIATRCTAPRPDSGTARSRHPAASPARRSPGNAASIATAIRRPPPASSSMSSRDPPLAQSCGMTRKTPASRILR